MSAPVPPDPAATFDAARAACAVRRVPIGCVVDLLFITHAPDRVAEYRERMREGSRFPPVSVVRLLDVLVVADGHKRLTAWTALGGQEVLVEVWGPRHLLADQWRQVRGNARKSRAILAACVHDPAEAVRLAGTTWAHWRRVAACLRARFLSG